MLLPRGKMMKSYCRTNLVKPVSLVAEGALASKTDRQIDKQDRQI
jgi:hypothetical protein